MGLTLQSALGGSGSKVQIIPPGGLPVFSLDCSDEEIHQATSKPTEFEIENGQTISDHVVIQPRVLTLTGVVVDAPLTAANALIASGVSAATGRILPLLGPAAGLLSYLPSLLGPGGSSRSKSAFLSLMQVFALRLPVRIVTSLYVYRNMWITSVRVPRTNKTGQTLAFTVTAQQLLLVQPQTVNIAQYSNADLAAYKASEGMKAAQSSTLTAAKQGFTAGRTLSTGGGLLSGGGIQ